MNDIIKAMEERRSIRKFKAEISLRDLRKNLFPGGGGIAAGGGKLRLPCGICRAYAASGVNGLHGGY